MPKIYASCRVSHEDSYKSGIGIEVQIDAIQNWAKYALSTRFPGHTWGTVGWRGHKSVGQNTTDGFFIDQAVSALKTRFCFRPAGSRLHGILQRGDVVVFARMDRGFRNSNDLSNTMKLWLEMGVVVVFLDIGIDTKGPLGQFLVTVLGAVCQMDSDIKSERSKEVHARLKANGRGLGHLSRGKRKREIDGVKFHEPAHYECLECQWIVRLRDERGISFANIAEMLEEKRAQLEGRPRWPVSPYNGHQNRSWALKSVERAYANCKAGKYPEPDLSLLSPTEQAMPTEVVTICRTAVPGFSPWKPEVRHTALRRIEAWRQQKLTRKARTKA